MDLKEKPKIIVILGPTASGKSDLAVKIAKKFNGEVISADSRQVYKGMDVGTGKVPRDPISNFKFQISKADKGNQHKIKKQTYFYKSIPHYLLDVCSPKKFFTVSQYKKLANQTIKEILKKGRLPIICGGTGFYIQCVIDDITIPKVKPDWKLRNKLEKKTNEELFNQLKKIDPVRAKNIDENNKRRLIRAIEIILKTKKPVPEFKKKSKYNCLIIGTKIEQEELKERIKKRLEKRLKQGMIEEVNNLHKKGISFKRLEDFGLEYRYIAYYLQDKIKKEEMIKKLQKEIEKYAKRQMTWFKRDKRINWVKEEKAFKLTKEFLNKKTRLCV